MNAILTILAVAASLSLEASDIRIIGSKSVDLQPIHDWMKEKKGVRPMPHWKEIHIVAPLGELGCYLKCAVQIERGSTTTNAIGNVPVGLLAKFAEVRRIEQRLAEWNKRLRAEARQVREAHALAPAAEYPGIAEANANIAGEKLRQSQEDRAALSSKLDALRTEIAATYDYAMFTGQSYGGFKIMDMGRKQAQ